MFGAILVIFLQAAGPAAAPPANTEPAVSTEPAAAQEQTTAAIPEGMMDCELNRSTRVRMCRTAEGEVLRCRRERILGSRLPSMVCMTHAEDQRMQDDTRDSLNRAQRITTPGGG